MGIFTAQAFVARQYLRTATFASLVVLFVASFEVARALYGHSTLWMKPLLCIVFLAAAFFWTWRDFQKAEPADAKNSISNAAGPPSVDIARKVA